MLTDRSNHVVMSRDQNTGRSYGMKTHNIPFERVGVFKSLGTTSANQNSIQKEKLEKNEVKKCLLSFGALYSVSHFVVQNMKFIGSRKL